MAALLSVDELTQLLARFGMVIEVDMAAAAADGVTPELMTARLAHALVGAVEAHASRAEDAARKTGADVEDIAEVALMAFAGAASACETDEWALIEWRATRLAMVLSGLDFAGPLKREGRIGSGDTLVRTIRQVAAALSAMATAKHAAADPLRDRGVARDAGLALARGMDVLEQAAKDVPLHRNIGQLMQMSD